MRRKRCGGWSGSTTLSTTVERFKTPDGVLHVSEPEDDESELVELEVDVELEGYYEPGCLTGPWENSYPEYRECNVIKTRCADPRFDGLTSAEEEKVKEDFYDQAAEPPEPEYDPCEHGRFGRRRRYC